MTFDPGTWSFFARPGDQCRPVGHGDVLSHTGSCLETHKQDLHALNSLHEIFGGLGGGGGGGGGMGLALPFIQPYQFRLLLWV